MSGSSERTIGWLKPLYGFTGRAVVSATRAGRAHLVEMGRAIAGTDVGVAIYITAAARGFGDEAYRGRVIGACWLAPLPDGKTADDFPFADIDGTVRWPVGWPLVAERTVKLPLKDAPELKPLMIERCGEAAWRRVAASFQGGAPARLDGELAPLAAALTSCLVPAARFCSS
jgi:hypothetical protein